MRQDHDLALFDSKGYSIVMRCRESGVAIGETLVGIFLLALILTALFNLIPTTILANRHGSQRIQADNLAQSTIAEVRTTPFDDLVVGTSTDRPAATVENVSYLTTVSVKAPPQGDPDRLKVVAVDVSWTMGSKVRRVSHELWMHRVIQQ